MEVIALPRFPLAPEGGFLAVLKKGEVRRDPETSTIRAVLETKRHLRPLVRLRAATAIEDGCRCFDVALRRRAAANPDARRISLKAAATRASLVNGSKGPALTVSGE